MSNTPRRFACGECNIVYTTLTNASRCHPFIGGVVPITTQHVAPCIGCRRDLLEESTTPCQRHECSDCWAERILKHG